MEEENKSWKSIMLLNDVTTQGQTVNLGQGVYQVKLFNLETIDPLDYIKIGGSNFQWRYQGQTEWMDGQFTEYADNINQSLIIELNVLDQTELTFRTDDTFDFPYDDIPTNPIIDIEISQLGDNSSIIQDGIGAINNNILSTGEGAVSVEEIQSTFFHHNIDLIPYGVEGSAALWGTEPGINKVDITVDGFANLLFWDGANITPFFAEGTQELYFNTVSDEWGFIVLDDVASNEASVTFDNVVWYDSSPDNIEVISYQEDIVLPDDWMIETLGDVEVDNTPNYDNGGNFMVGTGGGDRAVSTIGNNLMGDRNYLKPFGTEGSYLNISDIENGVYEFDVNQLGRIDDNNNDALYSWNGKQLTLIADNENGLITNSVDVIYGEVSFISVDVNTKTGTTDFTITGLEKIGDLSYSPPTPISLMPDIYMGDVDFYQQQTRINNGSGDRAVSTLSKELDIDLSMYGTEGSYATWSDLENGIYEITYSLYASENDVNHDNIYFYDGTNLNLFDSRSSATIQSSATRWISETKTQEVAVTDNQLTFITLDTVDKSGTTQLRINGIEKVATPINKTIDYISGAGEYNDSQFKLTIELGDNSDNPIQSFTMDFDGSNPILDNTTISQSNVVTMEISDYSPNRITVDLGQNFTGNEIEIIFDNVDTSKIDISDDKTVDLSFVSGTNGQNVTTIENEFSAELDPALDGNINSYFLSEPPFPLPANNKDLGNDPLTGVNLGTLKPWETDSNTGTEYNQGYVYGSYHLGASYITETIGGDDVSDWLQFNLDESSYLNFYHNNAIAQILDENQQVIIGSDDGYSGNLQAYLNSGNYYIGFSSESSTSELFNASIYLSNSDPNYAD